MRFFSSLLLVALLLSGCDFFRDGYDPVIRITGVVLQEVPLTRSSGQPWDPDGSADLILEIQNVGGGTLARSTVYPDLAALPDGGLTVDLVYDVRGERDYFLVAFDDDPGTPEVMAISEAFTYTALAATPGDTVPLGEAGDRLHALLRVTR